MPAMADAPYPPSKPERDALIEQRKRDLSRPASTPSGPGGVVQQQVNRDVSGDNQARAHQREERIRLIAERLEQAKDRAKREFRRVR